MVAMVLSSMTGNKSWERESGGVNSTCSNTELYCTHFNLAAARADMPTRCWRKSKITLDISVGYNRREWLINRAVHLWETCSIKCAGQCVFQQIAVVYFPSCLSPSTLPHAWLAALLGSVDVYQWSPLESYHSEGKRVDTFDLWPLPSLTRDEPPATSS